MSPLYGLENTPEKIENISRKNYVRIAKTDISQLGTPPGIIICLSAGFLGRLGAPGGD